MTSNKSITEPFADRLLDWWAKHGRHDLPWQQPRTPYRVWVSEIMLQQTRVEAVTDYFERFINTFPDLQALATAEIDQVLSLWSGLGYYARARNLHAAARILIDEFDGQFPNTVEQLNALPGIGRSTAAAICAQAFDLRAPILDGNVKRVLARHAAIEGWPGQTRVANRLWEEADIRTPEEHAADYTQAIMDLGASLCSRSRPSCSSCPVKADCQARIQQRQHELPTPKPRKTIPERIQAFDILRNEAHQLLMVRRPPSGIWGGLWCLPEAGSLESVSAVQSLAAPEPIRHAFSHFRLELQFHHSLIEAEDLVMNRNLQWRSIEGWLNQGIPRPIRHLLENLQ